MCGLCNYKTAFKAQLKVHMNTHTKKHKVMCDSCPQVFTSQSALCYHKKIHSGLNTTKCPECDKVLSKKNLKIHIISRHSGEDIINYERGFSQETKSKAIKLAKEVGSLEASKILGLKYATVVRWRSGYIKKKTKVDKESGKKESKLREKKFYTEEFKQNVAKFVKENNMEAASIYYNTPDGTIRRWYKLYNFGIICRECDSYFPY